MEVLLIALFFISVLLLFISGKDDFGRTENKLNIKETEKVRKDENIDPAVGEEKEAKLKAN